MPSGGLVLEKLTDQLDPQQFQALPELIDYCLSTHAELPGFSCFGKNDEVCRGR